MSRSKSKMIFGAVFILAGITLLAFLNTPGLNLRPAVSTAGLFDKGSPDHLTGNYTTIVDEQGNTISMMARIISVGDEILTSEGRGYRVEKVQGEQAEARFTGMDPQIVAYNEFYAGLGAPVMKDLAEKNKGSFALYHTHSDESYVPTDGKEAIPFKGGIYQVGKSIVDKLQGKGVQVNYDQTPHDPHDNNAYVRSRRTAANLMKTNPAAIFDVHRDGIPDPNYYRTKIEGQDVAKLRLVVGRENPRMDANMDFAKRMMTAANNLHPSVVKEIFVGKGDYNQDLMPTALLIEAGTHTNTREEAMKGVSMFTDAIPTVAGITPAAPGPAAPGAGGRPGAAGGAGKALAWILGLAVVGGLGYLAINSGGMGDLKNKISGFGKDFTSFFGPRRAVRKPGKTEPGAREEQKAPVVYDPGANEILKDEKDELTKD